VQSISGFLEVLLRHLGLKCLCAPVYGVRQEIGVGGVGVAWAHASNNTLKRLILRAVPRYVSPMVIRLVSVSDRTDLPGLHDVFHAILGWSGDLGYLVRIHGQEFNSFRRSTRSKALRDFQLQRQEKFLYVCDVMDPMGIGRAR
jgi:hypothetical protein